MVKKCADRALVTVAAVDAGPGLIRHGSLSFVRGLIRVCIPTIRGSTVSALINRRDLDFLLYEVLDAASLCQRPRYSQHDRETFESVIDAAHTLAEEKFLPFAAKLDANEPHFDGERVHIIPEVKDALKAYVDGGFMATGA